MPPFYLSVAPFYFQDFGSSLLSLLWILFQVLLPLHLFSLVGFYHVPSTAICFSLFSFYLMCCVWGSPFCRLQGHSSSYPHVYLPWVGLDHFLVKVSWLVYGTGSCLSEGQCYVQQCFKGVYGLGVVLGSLSANGQGCVPHTTWVRNWWWKCDVYSRERRRIPWPLSLVLTMQPAECSCSTMFTRPLVKSTSALFWQITTYLSLCHQLDSYCFET